MAKKKIDLEKIKHDIEIALLEGDKDLFDVKLYNKKETEYAWEFDIEYQYPEGSGITCIDSTVVIDKETGEYEID